MKPTRRETLLFLLGFDRPLEEIRGDLASFSWDSDEPVVTLDRAIVSQILRRYLQGALSATELEDWANAIEGREDIGLEGGYEEILKDLIFELANPSLTSDLDHSHVTELLDRLNGTSLNADDN